MRGGTSRDVLRQLQTLYRCGVVGPLSDEQLLDRFLARRDETAEEAFAELVHRHGPMVLGVCRRILGHPHDAEDAFQATFLVLARKAAAVLRREKVANWLHGVAVRTAQEARTRAARRRAREQRVRTPIHFEFEPADHGFPAELRAILDEELARLPPRYRSAVVLCELEGLSRSAAARRLEIPEGTLSSRLARAKALLRDRLARRGVAVPAAALSTALVRQAHATTLRLSLVESTVAAATLVAAGPSTAAVVSTSVVSLFEGVLKTMLFAKLNGMSLAIGTLAAVISGAVVLAQSGPAPEAAPVPSPAPAAQPRPGPPPLAATPAPAPADRTAALERKLDRILSALERMSPALEGQDRPSELEAIPRARHRLPSLTGPIAAVPGGDHPPIAVAPADSGPSDPLAPATPDASPVAPGDELPTPPADLVIQGRLTRAVTGSIADRLTAVERKLVTLQENVRTNQSYAARLQRRLVELEKRVGGPSSASSDDLHPPLGIPSSVRPAGSTAR